MIQIDVMGFFVEGSCSGHRFNIVKTRRLSTCGFFVLGGCMQGCIYLSGLSLFKTFFKSVILLLKIDHQQTEILSNFMW
jgi:hypothetical protein